MKLSPSRCLSRPRRVPVPPLSRVGFRFLSLLNEFGPSRCYSPQNALRDGADVFNRVRPILHVNRSAVVIRIHHRSEPWGRDDHPRAWETHPQMNELDLVIDHRSSITIGEIEATCRVVKRRLEREGRAFGVVIIDYLKQVRATERYRGQRVYEIGEITSGLRDIAKRLGLCVVLLAQLNRSVENRENKRPTLGDLRESGDIENDADVVLLLYRDAYYLAREAREAEPEKARELTAKLQAAEHELEVIIAKNRNGEGERTLPLFCDIGRSVVAASAWNDR